MKPLKLFALLFAFSLSLFTIETKAQVFPWGNGTFTGVSTTSHAITLILPTVKDNYTLDTLAIDTNVTVTVVAATSLRVGAVLQIKFRNLVATNFAHTSLARTLTLSTGCQCAAVVGTASKINIITLVYDGSKFNCTSSLLISSINPLFDPGSNLSYTSSIYTPFGNDFMRIPSTYPYNRPYQN